jgi:D-serine deaminase-like pyridoxal phosphate-dependent protein
MYSEVTTPAVIVDLDIAESNLSRMASLLQANGIRHRPHVKTHKSAYFAHKQLAAGAIGITVAKLSEAEVFVKHGIDDILIAYPIIGEDKLRKFADLHLQASLLATVDSMTGAEGLSRVGTGTGKRVQVLIEIDGGLHRTGRQPGEDAVSFAKYVRDLPGIEIAGIMGYFGNIYKNTSEYAFREAVRSEGQILQQTVEQLNKEGIPVPIVSTGSTPASLLSEHLEGVTEVRAGNYLFFDVSAMDMGLAKEEDCALRVIATVVSRPLPGKATIDAGSKTLTSDRARTNPGYGRIVGAPGIVITALNEEHGFLEFDPAQVTLDVGDRVEIIPNHSCVLPNLTDAITAVRGGKAVDRIPVDARGCNY